MNRSYFERKIDEYPAEARIMAERIRELVHEIALEEKLGRVEESLKWGEPSFYVTSGSPFRMDWKDDRPDKFFIFFVCRTKLVETFRVIYENAFEFEGNRAIVLDVHEELPEPLLKHCFSFALNYHKLKTLPLLGA